MPETRIDKGFFNYEEDDINLDNDDLGPDGVPFFNNTKKEMNFDIGTDANLENMARVDKEYEKHFGRLYKTFDVRYLKSKIWDSISKKKIKEESSGVIPSLSFKGVLESVTNSISPEVRSNISTQTCFVCLLHLANEKELDLQQDDLNNFLISF